MEMDAVLIVGLIVLGIYSLFALFVHRKERLNIIDKVDFSKLTDSEINLNMNVWSGKKFTGLRIGLLLMGLGLGLLIAFFIINGNIDQINQIGARETKPTIYAACILLFGGAGLFAAYLIERKSEKKK